MDIPTITGPGNFDIEVVGESYYLKSFEKICGPRCDVGVNLEVKAVLTLDDANPHDKKAVNVTIQGHPVGYLAKNIAREFRNAIKAGGLKEYKSFECDATIRGGWDDGKGSCGHYGVWLDIPQDDDEQ
jgi:hypothetical protein